MAVRGIIQKDKKYLLIYSKYGNHKFPGGGLKQMKKPKMILFDYGQTLVNEVKFDGVKGMC